MATSTVSALLVLLVLNFVVADDVSCANQEDGECEAAAADAMLQRKHQADMKEIKVHAKESGPVSLTLGQDTNWPPYAFRNPETGEPEGFGKDIAMGLNALCPDELNITVVETLWSNCWSSAGGGTLGALVDDGTLDGCMTYTHTRGVRNTFADFSYGILKINKAAGILTLLNKDGTPKVDGLDDLNGKTVIDVGGWAPTADGLDHVINKCTGQHYSSNYTLITGNGNDESLQMLKDGRGDAVFLYADQARNYQCHDGEAGWDCSLWKGFGTEYAYTQTGQFGFMFNGTTLVLAKKDSGVPALVNGCLTRFMKTRKYYDICVKHDFVSTCYPNKHFPSKAKSSPEYLKPTDEHKTGCANGYCACPA